LIRYIASDTEDYKLMFETHSEIKLQFYVSKMFINACVVICSITYITITIFIFFNFKSLYPLVCGWEALSRALGTAVINDNSEKFCPEAPSIFLTTNPTLPYIQSLQDDSLFTAVSALTSRRAIDVSVKYIDCDFSYTVQSENLSVAFKRLLKTSLCD